MSYAEMLRVRKALFVYAAIIAAVVLAIVISVHAAMLQHGGSGFHIDVSLDDAEGGRSHPGRPLGNAIPLGMLLGLSGYACAAFATVVAASLNRENERGGFVFTKPIGRARLALSYMAVDIVAIVAAYVYAFVMLCLVPLASFGLLSAIFVDAHAPSIALLGLGIGFLWYGVLQAITAGYRGRGGAFVGFSWLVFLVLSGLAPIAALGPIFHGILMLLNLINPFAYVTGITSDPKLGGAVVVKSIFNLSTETRAVMTWCIAAAGCALAIFAWKRVEV